MQLSVLINIRAFCIGAVQSLETRTPDSRKMGTSNDKMSSDDIFCVGNMIWPRLGVAILHACFTGDPAPLGKQKIVSSKITAVVGWGLISEALIECSSFFMDFRFHNAPRKLILNIT